MAKKDKKIEKVIERHCLFSCIKPSHLKDVAKYTTEVSFQMNKLKFV